MLTVDDDCSLGSPSCFSSVGGGDIDEPARHPLADLFAPTRAKTTYHGAAKPGTPLVPPYLATQALAARGAPPLELHQPESSSKMFEVKEVDMTEC